MTEPGQKHIATVETIQQACDVLVERIDAQALYDALAPTLLDIQAKIQALRLLPLDTLQPFISEAVSASIPSPTIQEIPETNGLAQVEGNIAHVNGRIDQL